MRYSVLGFNQSKIINETNLDLTDLILLQYIQQACASPKMNFVMTEDDKPLVWIYHSKLHQDLPILDMAESTLKNRLSNLKKQGFIQSQNITTNKMRGSRTYYGITEKTLDYLYSDEEMTTSRQKYAVERPRHSESTPYNQLNSIDNKLENTITINSNSNEFLGKIKSTKRKSLYEKCSDQISEFTTNIGLQEVLHDYLKIRLQMKDKPLYEGTWKGMLKKLAKMDNQIDVVNESIERGWASFFEHKSCSKGKEKFGEDDNIISEKGDFDSSGETF